MKTLSVADLLEIMSTYEAAIAEYRREIDAAYEEIEARCGYGHGQILAGSSSESLALVR